MSGASTRAARVASIDVMRGLVMMIMMVDHVREAFFLHHPVSDPMKLAETDPAFFFGRIAAHLCAPVFVFLTGLSAWLYAHPSSGPRSPAGFLFKRGLFLILLEITLITGVWAVQLSPTTVYLQVIWAIGLSMIALAALHRLPRGVLIALGLIIVFGHNLLTPISFQPGDAGYLP
nr:heparan-alpha-glucosaminide N-acetyltransferase domain-containing protein [uncultured Duganella sp.]